MSALLDWMHEEVKSQMREHPPGTCRVCDEKRRRAPRSQLYGPCATPPDIDEHEEPPRP